MPLVLDTPRSSSSETSPSAATIEIALLNNLADAGLESGERQFVDLLSEAAGSHLVRLRFFSLPQITRGPRARARLDTLYSNFADLMQTRVDGLIVTGCEPRAGRLPDEPVWRGLTDVVDWAEHNTRSTIWSCLAAHAAVLHLDGIDRRRLPEKCTGLFAVERVADHPLLEGAPETPRVPHSRFNDLSESELVASGYEILTRSASIGVDVFVKQWKSRFVYMQGHPEYDANALRGEYRRDVMRFLEGAAEVYPCMPLDYFSRDLEAALRAFATEARRDPHPDLASAFPLNGRRANPKPWRRAFGGALYRNWLRYLHATATDHAA